MTGTARPIREPFRIGRFGIAGGIGFCVDAGILWLATALAGLHPVPARVLSFAVALTTTWLVNRHWTFSDRRHHRPWGEIVRYAVVQGSGFMLNFAVFTGLVLYAPPPLSAPLVALVVGVSLSTCTNYLLMRFFVFSADRGARPPEG